MADEPDFGAASGITHANEPTRAIVASPVLSPSHREETGNPLREPSAKLEEAIGLAEAIDLVIVHAESFTIAAPKAATLLGSGKIDELAALVQEHAATVVIVDHALSPVQQRNLERALKAKVLDRTGLILEIFGERARTKEGTLQVELAHLEYQRGRLVRSWTHLERQRGGAGFLGGPGETQIEADRRLLREKISRLKRELETVKRTRELHRAKRQKVPYPIVAIVGYTNAGKSTLFNRLTGADVMAQDMLFATLDPTLRRVRLPNGTLVILSDTVGFISDLPTHLVAAFRATLEEVIEADLVLHLRDISDPDTEAQAEDVRQILDDLGVRTGDERMILEVWNKIDRLAPEIAKVAAARAEAENIVPISAWTGEGIDPLLDVIEERIAGALQHRTITLGVGELGLLDWIYTNATVVDRTDEETGEVTLQLEITDDAARRLRTQRNDGDHRVTL